MIIRVSILIASILKTEPWDAFPGSVLLIIQHTFPIVVAQLGAQVVDEVVEKNGGIGLGHFPLGLEVAGNIAHQAQLPGEVGGVAGPQGNGGIVQVTGAVLLNGCQVLEAQGLDQNGHGFCPGDGGIGVEANVGGLGAGLGAQGNVEVYIHAGHEAFGVGGFNVGAVGVVLPHVGEQGLLAVGPLEGRPALRYGGFVHVSQ